MSLPAITEHVFESDRHSTFYLASGPEDGPLVIFTHGWPELSLSWRHQLPVLAAMGYRAIAPDMRGYGRSTVYDAHEAYAQREAVTDMIELLDHLGGDAAVWVGHDWGAPVSWNIASHHPDRCRAVAGLCVPFATLCQGLDFLISLVDRTVYPEDQYPVGQWDYMRHYEESFDDACAPMDANPRTFIKAIFRQGDPGSVGQPAATAAVRAQGGWLGGLAEAPDLPLDPAILDEEELDTYATHLTHNGFFGPNSWYMNHEANAAYFAEAENDGRLSMPVLFLHARYDSVCETVNSKLAAPMRERCENLTEVIVDSGHWMAQEKPMEVNRALARWLLAMD